MWYTEQSSIIQFKLLHRLRYTFDIVKIKQQMCITELNESLSECVKVSLHFAYILEI